MSRASLGGGGGGGGRGGPWPPPPPPNLPEKLGAPMHVIVILDILVWMIFGVKSIVQFVTMRKVKSKKFPVAKSDGYKATTNLVECNLYT